MNEKETSRQINSNEYREANVSGDGTYVEGDSQNNSGSGDNVGGNKTEYHYYGNSNQQKAVKREKNQQILLDWIETEVNSRLKQSLHNHISILLDKEEDPLSVSPFWEMELKVDTRKQEKLPSGTTIYTVYDREDIKGRLLILGEPGSGKTTTLLQLAKVLVERAKNAPNQPIPMLFNLSAWTDDKQSIHDWIIDTLKAPPYGIKKELSERWLQEGIILPLLDGLDELASNRQKLCIDKLNEYLGKERAQLPLVICSRVKEFKHNQTQLFLNASIILQALRKEQIKDYIERTEGIELWEEIEQDAELLDLCTVPFFLSVIVIAYEKISLERWQNLASSEEKKNYILETYVNQMLARPYQGKRYDKDKTKHWLGCLAVQLIRERQTEFLIENIQPYWLSSRLEKLIYGLIFGLIFGLEREELDIKTSPNQGIKESVRNAFKLGLIAAIIMGMIVTPLIHFIVTPIANNWQLAGLSQRLYYAMILMMLWGIVGAGQPAIQHFSLRIVFSLKNYAPWNYAKFLDYGTNRLFLQRVGGGYRFIHRMLQEHFAYGSSEFGVRSSESEIR